MIETITHRGNEYPKFQSEGFAAQFAIPFAKKVCMGNGYDIGCNRTEWSLPGSIPIDCTLGTEYDAYKLPPIQVDYIFSSHCLEHLPNWVDALDYWTSKLHSGGVLFLYLPDYSQTYWRPYSNRKHIHAFRPEIIKDYLISSEKFTKGFVSGIDANNSFIAMAEKI